MRHEDTRCSRTTAEFPVGLPRPLRKSRPGVKPGLVYANGLGDSNPVAFNDTPEGRAQNRRVELTLSGAGN